MSLTVYQYAKCGTCRNALKWLKANHSDQDIKTIPIFDQPPSKEELRNLVQRSGLDIRKFFNTSGEVYKSMDLKDKLPQMSEEEMLELLASNGRLIKRPIVTNGERVTVGFKEAMFEDVWR